MKVFSLCLLVMLFNGCAAFQETGLHLTQWVIDEHWPDSSLGRVAMAPVVVVTGAADYAVIHPLSRIVCAGKVSFIPALYLGGGISKLIGFVPKEDLFTVFFVLAPAWIVTFPPTWVALVVVPCLTCPDQWMWTTIRAIEDRSVQRNDS